MHLLLLFLAETARHACGFPHMILWLSRREVAGRERVVHVEGGLVLDEVDEGEGECFLQLLQFTENKVRQSLQRLCPPTQLSKLRTRETFTKHKVFRETKQTFRKPNKST